MHLISSIRGIQKYYPGNTTDTAQSHTPPGQRVVLIVLRLNDISLDMLSPSAAPNLESLLR